MTTRLLGKLLAMMTQKVDGDVQAPEGYLFFGKLSFLCLGPASDFFSETLWSKGKQVTSVEEKKSMGHTAMLKEVTARWWE